MKKNTHGHKLKSKALIAAFWAFGAYNAAAQGTELFARFPSLSPDGKQISFSYQGDIWKAPTDGGKATRMTVHEGYESSSKWSPDGKQIAFSSNRHGSDDVYVMDAEGGEPFRLTFHSAADHVGGWTNDGKVIFSSSRREYAQAEWDYEIHEVSAKGGTPARVLEAVGHTPAKSPDGRFIAFVRGYNHIYRKGYQGPADKEVWIYDSRNKTYNKITEGKGNDMSPVWAGNETLYFTSEQAGTANLFKTKINGEGKAVGAAEQITRFETDGVRDFDVSADGSIIAMERQTDLYVMKNGGQAQKTVFTAPSDYRFDPIERKTYSGDISEYIVSPNGKQIAMVIKGDIFVAENKEKNGKTVRVTDHPAWDKQVSWINDSVLVFASDRELQYDLYLIASGDPKNGDLAKTNKFQTTRLTNTPADESFPKPSNDGCQIAYEEGRGKLIVATLENKALKNFKTLQDGWATPSGVTWSPDCKWLAFSKEDLYYNSEIYIQPADNSQPAKNVSFHPRIDNTPVWSPDGTKLAFISERSKSDADIWFVWLKKADWEKTKADWEEEIEAKAESKGENKEGGKDKDKKKKEEPEVIIDFENIHERLVQVTKLPGGERNVRISPDGLTFYFTNNQDSWVEVEADKDLFSIKWDGTELKQLTQGGKKPSDVFIEKDGKNIYALFKGGILTKMATADGKVQPLPIKARVVKDYLAEREIVFEESYRVMRDNFYDPKYHGADWVGLREKYKSWAMKTRTEEDFADVLNMYLGELNASHLAFRNQSRANIQKEPTGLLGAEVKQLALGVEVTRVVANSPADRSTSKLYPGDVILAVNGTDIKENTNLYSLLINEVGEKVLLKVKGKNGEREVSIRTVANLQDFLYEEWVADRKRLTEKYSGGKIGYIHIRGMSWESFERFERELTASGEGKDGLIIDVRFNGGGWTTDYLMSILSVRQHAYTIPRGATEDPARDQLKYKKYYPYGERLPFSAWPKPSVTICNANSYSNAEIFAHAFKNLGLGKVVGMPTFGAVISTGAQTLVDGSTIRMPFRGWYGINDDKNMENGPATPDYIIDNSPDYRAKDVDEQLQKSVEVLLQQLKGGK